MRSVLRFFWPSFGKDIECLVKWAVEKSLFRRVLNTVYNRLTYSQKNKLHARFAKLFRHRESHMRPGRWTVAFLGRKISVPLRKDMMWLDWDCALSVLGHESEIKTTYETLVRELGLPNCFFDVGANYGLHSLLFLVHGVDVVSFEPNPTCHEYLHALESANQVEYSLAPTALGASEGKVRLWYPDMETWLGTIRPERIQAISADPQLRHVEVMCATLDGIVRERNLTPDLIKLDTEGSELEILIGARETLKSGRPIIIFECWQGQSRNDLWLFLDGLNYVTVDLPLRSSNDATILSVAEFSHSAHTNFAAFPGEKLGR